MTRMSSQEDYVDNDDRFGGFSVYTADPDLVRVEADHGCDHVIIRLGCDDAQRLHAQLDEWLKTCRQWCFECGRTDGHDEDCSHKWT